MIGKNDASKSTILEAIYSLKAILFNQPQPDFNKILRSTYRQQHARNLWYGYSTAIDPTIELDFNRAGFKIRFHSTFDFNFVDVTVQIPGNKSIFLKLNSFLTQIQSQQNRDIIQTLEEKSRDSIENILFIDQLTKLRVESWENSIITKKMPVIDVHDVTSQGSSVSEYIGTEQRLMIGRGADGMFLDVFGDGRKTGLSLLSSLSYIKNTVILVEEIETHQHPDSLRKLIMKFIEICVNNNNQAFVTTHSPEVLQLFSTSKETKLFHLRRLENKNVSVGEINEKDVGMIRDIGWNLGSILSYEKFVLVEGEMDKNIFENSFFKLKNYWPEEQGITFVLCYGIEKQKELLKSLSFPDKKIFVQRDHDGKNSANVKAEIFDEFKQLMSEGYQNLEDDDKIELTKNGIKKVVIKNNVIVTGLPSRLVNVKKHATDDYILDILIKKPDLIQGINLADLEALAESSKVILTNVLSRYDHAIVKEIIEKCDPSSFPQELKDIINSIEGS